MKKLMILITTTSLLAACGREVTHYPPANYTSIQGPAGAEGPQGDIGQVGAQGTTGQNGSNGTNGEGFDPGLLCSISSITATSDENGTINWAKMLADATPTFTTVLSQFNVPNQVDTTLFSSFTAAQQAR